MCTSMMRSAWESNLQLPYSTIKPALSLGLSQAAQEAVLESNWHARQDELCTTNWVWNNVHLDYPHSTKVLFGKFLKTPRSLKAFCNWLLVQSLGWLRWKLFGYDLMLLLKVLFFGMYLFHILRAWHYSQGCTERWYISLLQTEVIQFRLPH